MRGKGASKRQTRDGKYRVPAEATDSHVHSVTHNRGKSFAASGPDPDIGEMGVNTKVVGACGRQTARARGRRAGGVERNETQMSKEPGLSVAKAAESGSN
ncbi:hypothetical protein CABS01_06585 [Colletotrichum abscissum]|uniref:Uncharacterized protein n=1 Tax=Colletotrichum abscissum TaxID=1671311 RepID=A0A9P9XHI2_9PEZI|nr:uncharacterized protein CABS01_06585 [Colletotrichum abscissum]KAI3554621.1 hypothetical protein CABS02_05102 [Colletotrichum abscissum]KAK1514606.1 hypothetical protein CABS01_06585 [Colletotrichum abscissum]